MSINFEDQSEYSNDMEELDDLAPAAHGLVTTDEEGTAKTIESTRSLGVLELDEEPAVQREQEPRDRVDLTPSRFDPLKHASAAEADALAFFAEPSVPTHSSSKPHAKNPTAPAIVTAKEPTDPGVRTSSDEEAIREDQRRVLLVQIARYRETWPCLEELMTFPPNLHKKQLERLEAIRNECSARVQNRNCMKGLRIVFNGAMSQFEGFVTSRFSSVELQGFARACEMDEVVQDSIKELEIKYLSSTGVMAPEARLIMGLLLVAFSTHTKNSTKRLIEGVAHSRAPVLPPQYQDL